MTLKQNVLLNPGPVIVSNAVKESLQQPDICHREDEFFKVQRRVREKIVQVCDGDDDYTSVVFSGSGTASLEAAVSLVSNVEGTVLVINNGSYGERIKQIAELRGADVRELHYELDDPISISEVADVLKHDDGIEVVAMVHHETTTGRLNPVSEIGELTDRHDALFLVDAISSVGAEELSVQDDRIDFCVGVSNKCIQGIPGVSFVCARRAALERFRGAPPAGLYLDLIQYYDAQRNDDTPFTPAVQAFYALDVALDELLEEGIDQRRARYRDRAAELREGLCAIGFESFLPLEEYSSTLATLRLPADIGYNEFHDGLKDRGYVIYAAKPVIGRNAFRISNMGELTNKHTAGFLESVEETLAELRRDGSVEAVILAAGMGRRLGNISKPLLEFGGETLIERTISCFHELGIENVTVVTGFKEEAVRETVSDRFETDVQFVSNPDYAESGSGDSLRRAANVFAGSPTIVVDADILYDPAVLPNLINGPKENVALVDPRSSFTGEEVCVFAEERRAVGLGKDMRDPDSYTGEALGMYRFSAEASEALARVLKEHVEHKGKEIEHEEVFNSILSEVSLQIQEIPPVPWIEIDTEADLKRARSDIYPLIGVED